MPAPIAPPANSQARTFHWDLLCSSSLILLSLGAYGSRLRLCSGSGYVLFFSLSILGAKSRAARVTGAATPPPMPHTSSGSPSIDPARVGLLPKRAVSLVGADGSAPAHAPPDDEDEDDLEYVENPFEERRR
jgi:hypothetical protein